MEKNDIIKLRNEAKLYNKNKNFDQATVFYEQLFNVTKNYFDGIEFIFCLFQIKKYQEALDVCRLLYLENKEYKNISNLYAQAIYFTQIQTQKKETFMKAANAIVKLTSATQKYSPYINTVIKTLSFLKKNEPKNYNLLLEWTNKVSVPQLNTKAYLFTNAKTNKTIKLPSQLEQWSLHKANALKSLNRNKELLIFINKILENNESRKWNNYVWIIRLQGIALQKMGKPLEAQVIYAKIVLQKNDWFIIYEYAKIITENKDYKKALQVILGIEINKSPLYAVALILPIVAKLLINIDNTEFAKKILVEAKNNKQTPELNKLWNKLQQQITTANLHKGTIIKILANNNAGFIKEEGSISIYFELKNYLGEKGEVTEGLKVSFTKVESYDKKKQKKSFKAIGINKINL